MGTTTWRKEFEAAREPQHNETRRADISPVVAVAPEGIDLDREFNDDYGGSEGEPVLIWTEERVYFPVVYDGSEWLGSAPRNPVSEGQEHVGGQ
jgi:hypothetical protein